MHDCLTWGFVQMWFDKQTSANCKSRQWFGLAKIAGWLSLLESCIKLRYLTQDRLFAARLPGSMAVGRQVRMGHCTRPYRLR